MELGLELSLVVSLVGLAEEAIKESLNGGKWQDSQKVFELWLLMKMQTWQFIFL